MVESFAILLLWIVDNIYHGNDENMMIMNMVVIRRNGDNDHNDYVDYNHIYRRGYKHCDNSNSTWLLSLEIKTKLKVIVFNCCRYSLHKHPCDQ